MPHPTLCPAGGCSEQSAMYTQPFSFAHTYMLPISAVSDWERDGLHGECSSGRELPSLPRAPG